MLPQNTIQDDGSASVGTVYGGPFTGPDTILENNETRLTLDRDVTLKDAISQLSDGSTPTQSHAYLVSVGDLQNVVVVLYSTQMVPGAAFRKVPAVNFKKGETIYVRGVQLSEASTAAAEATQLILNWA